MDVLTWLAGVLAAGLFVYLIWVLWRAEDL